MQTTQANNVTSPRLEVLRQSLAKKQAAFEQRLSAHMDDVKSANGQPLNDKRNGASTMGRWDKQNSALRTLKQSIEKTERAIEREFDKVLNVASVTLPAFLQAMVEAGELNQWRKHPETFFVPGVDKGRIFWDAKNEVLRHRYLSEIPKDQFPKFKDAFNKANGALRQMRAA
jgi:hypothetical protein